MAISGHIDSSSTIASARNVKSGVFLIVALSSEKVVAVTLDRWGPANSRHCVVLVKVISKDLIRRVEIILDARQEGC